MKRMFPVAIACLSLSCAFGAEAETEKPSGPAVPRDALVVPWTRFNLQYSVRDLGGSSPRRVEFYMTADGGKTWKSLGEDPDAKSPFTAQVPGDGVYGFRSVGTDSAGRRERPPQPGGRPEMVVVVDRTAPTARWIRPEQPGLLGDKGIDLAWEAEDLLFGPRPVAIEVSRDGGKAWRLVKGELPAKGEFVWTPPAGSGGAFLFRLAVKDRAGNKISLVCPNRILADRTPPSARITGPALSASAQFDVEYQVEDDPSGAGIAKISLWYTSDNGQTWNAGPADEDGKGRIRFTSPVVGSIGLMAVAADKAGNEGEAPKEGTPPPFVVEVDNEPPQVRVDPGFMEGSKVLRGGRRVTVQWSATDLHIKDNSAELDFYDPQAQKWAKVAEGLPANGTHAWKVPAEVNADGCYLRVTVADTLGNTGEAKSFPFRIKGNGPAETGIENVRATPKTQAKSPAVKVEPSEDEGLLAIPGQSEILDEEPEKRPQSRKPARPAESAAPESKPVAAKPVATKPPAPIEESAPVEKPSTEEPVAAAPAAPLPSSLGGGMEEPAETPAEKPIAKPAEKPVAKTPEKPAAPSGLTPAAPPAGEDWITGENPVVAKVPEAPAVPAAPGTGGRAADLVQEAGEMFKNGQKAQALARCSEALTVQPGHAGALGLLSQISFADGKYAEAAGQAEKAIAGDKTDPANYLALGNATYTAAREMHDNDLARRPKADLAGGEAAKLIEQRDRNLARARGAFTQAARLAPDRKEAHDRLADTLYLQARTLADRDPDKALETYREAGEAYRKGAALGKPTYRESFQLGVCSLRLKDPAEAQRWLEQSIEIAAAEDINPKESFWYLGEILQAQGKLPEALRYWEKAQKAYKDGPYKDRAKERVEELKRTLGEK